MLKPNSGRSANVRASFGTLHSLSLRYVKLHQVASASAAGDFKLDMIMNMCVDMCYVLICVCVYSRFLETGDDWLIWFEWAAPGRSLTTFQASNTPSSQKLMLKVSLLIFTLPPTQS